MGVLYVMTVPVNNIRGVGGNSSTSRSSLWETFLKKQKNNFSRNYKSRQKESGWTACILSSQKMLWSKTKYSYNKIKKEKKVIRKWSTSLNQSYTNLYKKNERQDINHFDLWSDSIRQQSKTILSYYYNNNLPVQTKKNYNDISEEWLNFLSQTGSKIRYKIKNQTGWDKVIHYSAQYLRKRISAKNIQSTKTDRKNYLKVYRGILLAKHHRTTEKPWVKFFRHARNNIITQHKTKGI